LSKLPKLLFQNSSASVFKTDRYKSLLDELSYLEWVAWQKISISYFFFSRRAQHS